MTENWNQHLRRTFNRFDEALLRQVAHKLCKPRNQWPFDELLDRLVAAINNAAMVDRRLKELPAACRQILAAIACSRQVRWPLGALVETLVALGHSDGLAPIVSLLDSGLLLPELFPVGTIEEDAKIPMRAKLRNFESWLTRSDSMPMLLAPQLVTQRTLGEDLGITCPQAAPVEGKFTVHEADGLDWPLRLAVLWQQALDAPLRRTQQGDFFKRDYERLQADPVLGATLNDALVAVPDPGFFAAALASASGLLKGESSEASRRVPPELRSGDFSGAWKSSLPPLIAECWTMLPTVTSWHPTLGNAPTEANHPYSSAYLLAMLLLTRLPDEAWASPQAIETWIAERHPYWLGRQTEPIGIVTFLLGIAYTLRLLQATKGPDSAWLIRLSPLGRWVLKRSEQPPALPAFKQTLLVQPNLEMLAYRQGLTPELIVTLSKLATWKGLGPACTLQLEPGSVYRALEMGESQTSIVQLLEGHSMKAMPTAVLDSLRTWSSKRERISVYSAGAIFEFASPTEMNEAITRGLPAVRLSDRLAIVANESQIDYKQFRLTGTRDYTLPPEKCVDVDPDGVTLRVDLTRSDLLLETELQRFAALVPTGEESRQTPGRRHYRVTPASIATARQQGVSLAYLKIWFTQRTGLPISPAAELLVVAPDSAPIELRRQLVLHVRGEELASGLAQWPGTRELIVARLGPAALVVEEKSVPALMDRLKELGVKVLFEG